MQMIDLAVDVPDVMLRQTLAIDAVKMWILYLDRMEDVPVVMQRQMTMTAEGPECRTTSHFNTHVSVS